ncbi:hypothetical protein CLOM_g18004 [Closterium sp. NIES-68]|nr:hypothetical protein CLOM_g18004 [Closterium sp. NIES-68]GJP70131.1 hypothetical protein CLOP_g1111 [Closterium sp. NIES-67]
MAGNEVEGANDGNIVGPGLEQRNSSRREREFESSSGSPPAGAPSIGRSGSSQSDASADRWLSDRSRSFGPSVIVEVTRLAKKRGAINLGEGFPDYPAPQALKDAGIAAIAADVNQYDYNASLAALVASTFSEASGIPVDPETEVALSSGQTCSFASACLAVFQPGDDVILFDPAFEAYHGAILIAGANPVYVPLSPPHWTIDFDLLSAALTPRTKAIVLNSPCNPTGRVFSHAELSQLAAFCQHHDLLAITDEVYSAFTYGGARHMSLAHWPGMKQRCIVTSSVSKTFHVTGWRVGWAIAPAPIAAAISTISAKLIDTPPAPFQEASRAALSLPSSYYTQLMEDYTARRDMAVAMLLDAGLEVPLVPEGSVFVFARIPERWGVNDLEFCRRVIEDCGVAFVPGRIFFHPAHSPSPNPPDQPPDHPPDQLPARSPDQPPDSADRHVEPSTNPVVPAQHRYVRVAFCKSMETLRAARGALKHMQGMF